MPTEVNYAQVTVAIVSGVVVFVLGQIFQQNVLEPLREFRRQRADTIYFALYFIEFVKHQVAWDEDDKKNVKQMRAALIQSMEMVPCFGALSALGLLGLPSRRNVRAAAEKMAALAKYAQGPIRKEEPSAVKLGRDIIELLGLNLKRID